MKEGEKASLSGAFFTGPPILFIRAPFSPSRHLITSALLQTIPLRNRVPTYEIEENLITQTMAPLLEKAESCEVEWQKGTLSSHPTGEQLEEGVQRQT